jgi:hypothetical protein
MRRRRFARIARFASASWSLALWCVRQGPCTGPAHRWPLAPSPSAPPLVPRRAAPRNSSEKKTTRTGWRGVSGDPIRLCQCGTGTHARTHGVVKERKKPTRRPAASPSRLASAAGEVAGADEARIDGRLLSAVSWLLRSAHTGKRNPTTGRNRRPCSFMVDALSPQERRMAAAAASLTASMRVQQRHPAAAACCPSLASRCLLFQSCPSLVSIDHDYYAWRHDKNNLLPTASLSFLNFHSPNLNSHCGAALRCVRIGHACGGQLALSALSPAYHRIATILFFFD